MVKNKHKNLRWIFVACLALALILSNIIISNSGDPDINITKLPEEFVTNYLNEVAEIPADQKDNVLIITSARSLPDTYGATKVIEAPNHQYILQYDSETDKNNAIRSLKDDNLSVQQNYKYKLMQDYNSWGVTAMGIDYALENIPSTSQNAINAAVIDSGLDIDLFNTYFAGKLAGSYNAVDPSHSVTDPHGHGTHISGTIAEATPSYVKVFAVQASETSDGNLYTADIITGINYITYYHKADVINMSFGGEYTGDQEDTALYQAIEAAKEQNIISVAAAGNESTNRPSSPASFDNTISISAVDRNNHLASFSNYGDTITFAAPGVSIKSILPDNLPLSSYKMSTDDADHGTISGTSMAAPHATAAVAILKSVNPSLTLDNTINALKDHAIDIGTSGWDTSFGYGLISFADTTFCSNSHSQNCDEYGVFRKMVADQIAVTPQLTDRNYYSLTNILSSTISVTGTDGLSATYTLGELDEITISGYNPLASGEQTVTVEYLGFETSFKVTNPANYASGWTYQTATNNTITITDYIDSTQNAYKLYVPSQIDGKNVTNINANTFANSTNAANYIGVILPSTISGIGYGVFNDFSELVTFQSLADDFLVGNAGLSQLPKLQNILGNILLNDTSIHAFFGDTVLSTITLSDNTTVIPESAFANCGGLHAIVLPDNITTIGESAFYNAGLNAIALGNHLTTIGPNAFNGANLESINIPASVTSIDATSFGWNFELKAITVATGNPVYDSRNNSNAIIETATNTLITGIPTTTIPNTVTTIAAKAFYNPYIADIAIPSSVQTIATDAFHECFSLFNVKFPANHINIAENVMSENTGSNSIVGTTFWVYDGSDTMTYAINHDITYKIINPSNQDNRTLVGITAEYKPLISGEDYRAFEQITPDNLRIIITYDDNTDEVIDSFTSVSYQDGFNSLRTSAHFTGSVTYNTKSGYQGLTTDYSVTVLKANPSYTIPSGFTADPGQTLSEFTLPNNFYWMDASTIIEGAGNVTYYAKYVPTDTDNYNIIENIPISFNVRTPKALFTPTFSIAAVPYNDSIDHIDPADITITNLTASDYTVVNSTITSQSTATITIRLSDAKFEDYYLEGGIQEKAYDVTITTTPITTDYSGAYDGSAHSFSFNIDVTGCTIVYALDGENFNITTKPSFTDIGNNFVDMRISCPNRETISNSAFVSIQGFTVGGNLAIVQTAIVVPNNQTANLTENITFNPGLMGTVPELLDGEGTDLGFPYPETLKTGYRLRYIIGSEPRTYDIVVLGDNTGDGEINDSDFTKLRQYLLTGNGLDGIYLTASDVLKNSGDQSSLDSGDLLLYKQHILNIKTIGGGN